MLQPARQVVSCSNMITKSECSEALRSINHTFTQSTTDLVRHLDQRHLVLEGVAHLHVRRLDGHGYAIQRSSKKGG